MVPGECAQVYLVGVDEAHVLKHAQNTLWTHTRTSTGEITRMTTLSPRFLSLTPRYPSSLDAGSLPVMADVPETPTGAHNLLRHGRQ